MQTGRFNMRIERLYRTFCKIRINEYTSQSVRARARVLIRVYIQKQSKQSISKTYVVISNVHDRRMFFSVPLQTFVETMEC